METNNALSSCRLPTLAYSPIMMTLVITSALRSAKPISQYLTLYSLSRSMSYTMRAQKKKAR